MLEFPSKLKYFILKFHNSDPYSSSIYLTEDFSSILEHNDDHTRISPVLAYKETTQHKSNGLLQKGFVLFISRINPSTLLDINLKDVSVYFSIGLYNVICIIPNKRKLNTFTTWLQKKNKSINYEIWEINKGFLDAFDMESLHGISSESKDLLIDISKYSKYPQIQSVVNEYIALMKIVLYKSYNFLPSQHYENLVLMKRVLNILHRIKNFSDYDEFYPALKHLTNINASLSRFSSQTYTGTTPILYNESHFWSNSFLGIGLASKALINLRKFIQQNVGEQRIPEIIDYMKTDKDIVDLFTLEYDDEFFKKDHFKYYRNKRRKEILEKDLEEAPIIPLITYFSARDGFKTYLHTLSASLESVLSANTLKWSLMTITHEISHNIISAVLSKIYPKNNAELHDLYLMIGNELAPRNMLEMTRKYIFTAVVRIYNLDHDIADENFSAELESFKKVIFSREEEVEETITHLFDFMYFYGGKASKYIPELWISWSVIPGVKKKLIEYLIRSVCALSINFINTKKDPILEAKNELKKNLEVLLKSSKNESIISEALKTLDSDWDLIEPSVDVKIPLIQFAKTFIYSNDIFNLIYKEKYLLSGTLQNGGYRFSTKELADYHFSNPVRFIDKYAQDKHPNITKSFWLYYHLVFNLYLEDG